jgi:hypothetical protein
MALQILKVILFGPGVLSSDGGACLGSKMIGKKWGLTSVTPGAITFAAIIVCLPLRLLIVNILIFDIN